MQSFRNINNIKYDQIKKLRNFVNSSEAFLVCISAFDTTGSKTADKVFLDCDKKNNNWHCCKQRGCKQILPFHHIVAIEDCNTDCQRFQDICRNQCQSNGIFVPGVDEYENQGSNDTRCCYRKKDTDQGRNLSTAVYGSCPLRKTGGRSCATMGAPDFRRSRRTPWTKHASPPLMP